MHAKAEAQPMQYNTGGRVPGWCPSTAVMDKLATMDTIGSSFRPQLSCPGICLLNRHQTGDTDSVQPVILLPVQRDSQETFIPCEARMLWYSADRTSSQQLRDTTQPIEDRAFGGAEGFVALVADEPLLLPRMDTNIALARLASGRARQIGAKYRCGVH